MSKRRPLKFIELDTGCYVCVSHKTNPDGYLRWNSGDRHLHLFHRVIWQEANGPIPDGYEINHMCGNRSCQNLRHLECISGTAHTIKTNQNRYVKRKDDAHVYWRDTHCTGTHLGEVFGVSFATGCGWIRNWSETH